MEPDIQNIRDFDPLDERPQQGWPQISSYMENGILVRVFKAAWCLGAKQDFIIKSLPRK